MKLVVERNGAVCLVPISEAEFGELVLVTNPDLFARTAYTDDDMLATACGKQAVVQTAKELSAELSRRVPRVV